MDDMRQDRGPWKVIPSTGMRGGVCVASDDFTHDVLLRINGDFENDAARLAYADWLADRLNGYDALRAERAALRAAAGKVTCKRCGGHGDELWSLAMSPGYYYTPCPDCAALRALLNPESPK